MTTIGLGCVTFGREIDEPAAQALLDHAHMRGVSFFDTASAYAQGMSESILGRWLSTRRPPTGSVTIATKMLPPYEPERMEAEIDKSLERLGIAAIDLLYLHRWDASAETPTALMFLDTLVKTGKVRALGVSNYTLQQLETARTLQQQYNLTPFSVVQNNHNLAVSDLSAEFIAFCAIHDIAIVTYSPLGAGFLTGKHRTGVAAGSRFEIIPGHQDVYFHEAAYQRLAKLEAVAARTGHSPAHLALAWALHQPGITSVLIGGRTPAHLDQAFAALDFDNPDLFNELTD